MSRDPRRSRDPRQRPAATSPAMTPSPALKHSPDLKPEREAKESEGKPVKKDGKIPKKEVTQIPKKEVTQIPKNEVPPKKEVPRKSPLPAETVMPLSPQLKAILAPLKTNEAMLDLLVELIHGAYMRSKATQSAESLKRKIPGSAVAAKPQKRLGKMGELRMNDAGDLRKGKKQEFLSLNKIKRDRDSIEMIEREMKSARRAKQ